MKRKFTTHNYTHIYPICPKCKKNTFGIYCRGKLNEKTKMIFERLEEYLFCPYCDKIFKRKILMEDI